MSVVQDTRNNNGATVTGTIISGKAAAGDDFTITFDMRLSSSSNQTNTEFQIKDASNSGNIISLKETGTWATTWTLNGTSTQVTLPNSNKADKSNTIADVTWCSYKITRSGDITFLTITNKETSAVIFERAAITGSSATGGLGNIVFISSRYLANFAIDNIVVREVEEGDVPDVTYYTATFTETNSLAPTVKIYSNAGRTSEVTNGALTDGTTYYYRAVLEGYNNYEESFTVDGADPSVSFTMTAKTRYTFKACAVNSVGGAILETFYTDEDSYEGKKHNIVYPKYLTGTGNIVTYSKDNDTYGESVTASAANETHEVSYTAYDGVAYFVEVEDVVSATDVSSWNYSNGGAVRGFTTAKSIFTVPATGIYDVTYAACNNNVNYDMAVTLSKNETEIATKSDFKSISVNYVKTTGIVTNSNISLAKDDVLKLTPSTTNAIIDYMLVELKSVSKTITSAGWATYCSPYALDFSSSIANLTNAYLVTGHEGSTLTLSPITTTIPANTGILLEGEGAVSILVVASSSTDVSANILKGVTAATAKDAESIYVLMGSPKVGFYKNNNEFTVGANTAYIDASDIDSGGARAFYLFGDETTGISLTENSELRTQNAVYDLQGRRVAQPQKGLYIVNGKKVVIK